jgi:hypothetical protein
VSRENLELVVCSGEKLEIILKSQKKKILGVDDFLKAGIDSHSSSLL